ncbi:MAG: kinase [Blautia sp.]|jgi:hypothetical protein
MRLAKIQEYFKEKGWEYRYTEEEGLGSLDFEYRGVPYHIWEFKEDGFGVETNIRNGGKTEDIGGDYEARAIAIMESWQ